MEQLNMKQWSVYLPETKKLIEQKDGDKQLIKNWHPISLLNIGTKLIPKVIAIKLKKILNNLISENQISYLNNRFIKE